MPLKNTSKRTLCHQRNIEVKGYRRDDGLWDIEAHMLDLKPFSFENRDRGGFIHAGEALHDMWLRVTIDDHLLIHQCQAAIDASPFAICPQVEKAYAGLKGIHIAPGWTRKVRQLTGGVQGCTHLNELLKPIATVAFQTIYGAQYAGRKKDDRKTAQPPFLNTCHTFDVHSEVVRDFWPEFYQKKKE